MVADADLAPIAEGTADVERGLRLAITIVRHLDVVGVKLQISRLDAQAGRDEPGARLIQRLIELALHFRIAANLHIRHELAAELVEFGQDEARRRVVAAVALEIILQIQSETYVVGSPGLAPRADLESGLLIGAFTLIHQRVVQRLEIAEAVQLRDPLADRLHIQWLAHERLHLRHDGLFIALRLFIDAHELDGRQPRFARSAAHQVIVVRRVADAQRVEPLEHAARGAFAGGDGRNRRSEVGGTGGPQVRLDQYIRGAQGSALTVRILAHQNREHLIGNRQGRVERVARLQGKTHVGDDEDVRVHLPRHIDGQIFRQPTVDQQEALGFHRRKQSWCGNAGAHGNGEISLVQQYGTAGDQVGGHRAKWRRQQVKVGAVAERQRELAQRLLQLLALNEPLGQENLAVLQAERQTHQKIPVILLAPEGQVAARRRIAERLLPIDRAHRRLNLCGGHAAGIQATDDGAHAGAGNAVDGYL